MIEYYKIKRNKNNKIYEIEKKQKGVSDDKRNKPLGLVKSEVMYFYQIRCKIFILYYFDFFFFYYSFLY